MGRGRRAPTASVPDTEGAVSSGVEGEAAADSPSRRPRACASDSPPNDVAQPGGGCGKSSLTLLAPRRKARPRSTSSCQCGDPTRTRVTQTGDSNGGAAAVRSPDRPTSTEGRPGRTEAGRPENRRPFY